MQALPQLTRVVTVWGGSVWYGVVALVIGNQKIIYKRFQTDGNKNVKSTTFCKIVQWSKYPRFALSYL